MPKVVAKNNDQKPKIFKGDHYQSLDNIEREFALRRPEQVDLRFSINELLIPTYNKQESALNALRQMNLGEDIKGDISESIQRFYRYFPKTSLYFIGSPNEDFPSHLVLKENEDDPGRMIPLSQVAKETTLSAYFGLSQSTLNKLNGELIASLLNHILNTNESSVFRGEKVIRINHEGEVRSIHSKQYKFIDCLEIISVIKEFVEVDEASKFDIYVDETSMKCYFIFKNHENKKYKGDVISAGLAVTNSEVGCSAVTVSTMLNVNDTRFFINPAKSSYSFREIHKGKDEAGSLENLGNHLDFATNYIIEVINKYKTFYNIEITNIKDTFEYVCLQYQEIRSKKVREHLISQAEDMMAKNGKVTFRDLVHLIANVRTSKRHDDINTRHRLQSIAGDIINYSKQDILKALKGGGELL